jgi:carbonic anhydrase
MGERYVYRGSLTTPPYSEPLLWNFMPEVISISEKTLSYFGGNERVRKEFNDKGGQI